MKNQNIKKASQYAMLGLIIASLTIVSKAGEDELIKVKRVGGKDRMETAIEISKDAGVEDIQTAIISGYSGEVDALTGTSLTKKFNGRMFMTKQDELSSELLKEINNLNVEDIMILGGTSVVGESVEQELKADGFNVRRIAGKDRQETSYEIAKLLTGGKTDEAFVALGYEDFADALAIGPVSAKEYKPILLTDKNKEATDDVVKWLKELEVKKVTIIGGTTAVSREKENAYKALGIEVERIGGKNREETSVMIAGRYNKTPDNIIVTNGYKTPDAANAGYYANKKNASIIVTPSNELKKETMSYITATKKPVTIIGRLQAVSQRVEDDIDGALNGTVSYKTIYEDIPFKTIRTEDSSLEKGKTKLQTKGDKGTQEVKIKVITNSNGITREERVSIIEVVPVINEVILVGTRVDKPAPSTLKRDAALEKEIAFIASGQDYATFQFSKENEDPKGAAIIDTIVKPFVNTTATRSETIKKLEDISWTQKSNTGHVYRYSVIDYVLFDKTYPKGTNRTKIAEEAQLALLDTMDDFILIRVYTNNAGQTIVKAAALHISYEGKAINK